MSTSYYLIDKEEKKIEDKLNTLIERKIINLKNELLYFSEKQGIGIEDDIDEHIRKVEMELDYLFKANEIKICRTTYKSLSWDCNIHFNNMSSFLAFYMKNKEKYIIVNEYLDEFTIDEFLEKMKEIEIQ